MSSKSIYFMILISVGLTLSAKADFKKVALPFLEKYCMDCHDDETQEGDINFHNITDINDKNATLWHSIWEQVALKDMPPRKKKNQPDLIKRLEISQWITSGLTKALKKKGGFTDHMRPIKANHLDHDLLFNAVYENLEPSSSPARIWRIHPQEHLVRLNELIANEPKYNPAKPGLRTRGDLIASNLQSETKVYFGLDRYIGHVGGTAAYAASVTGFPAILSTVRDHGLKNYPFLYTVNSSEATQITTVAEQILRFMAYGPDAEPYQFADHIKQIDEKYKHEGLRGLPTAIFYSKEVKRPLTPVYDLMKTKAYTDKHLQASVDYLFEALTLRPPTAKESSDYLSILKETIKDVGKEEGVFMGLSPIFLDRDALFRTELAKYGKPDAYGRVMLQDHELELAINSAFSFIKPNDALRQSMKDGKLKSRADVKREVERILNDPAIRKPRVLLFFREFFEYDLCASVCKDEAALKKAGAATGNRHYAAMNGMIHNTDRLVELILAEDKNVLKELLTTNRIIIDTKLEANYLRNIDKEWTKVQKVNLKAPSKPKKGDSKEVVEEKKKALAKHKRKLNKLRQEAKKKAEAEDRKGIFMDKGKKVFIRTPIFIKGEKSKTMYVINDKQRKGILTHPSWLVSHSDAMDNHAILRGKWIRERLLGDAVADVPITVDAMLPDEPQSTLRHRMRVTTEKECWRCHKKMDPLGLPFEMYNHVGLLRNKVQGKPVNTSGEIFYSGDPVLDGPVKNALDMIDKLAKSERVEQVFVRHAFRYWMGRNETINDAPILQAAHKAYKENGGSMKALLLSLLTSDAFLYRKVK